MRPPRERIRRSSSRSPWLSPCPPHPGGAGDGEERHGEGVHDAADIPHSRSARSDRHGHMRRQVRKRRGRLSARPRKRRHGARRGRTWRDIHRQADAPGTAVGRNGRQPDRTSVPAVRGLKGAVTESIRAAARTQEKRSRTSDGVEIADLLRSSHLEELDSASVK